MIFKDGYLNDLDTLHQLPLEVLEDSILRIYEDKYLSLDTKADLLGDYLYFRKHILDRHFTYAEKNLQRISEMNNLLEIQTTEAIHKAWRIYQDELIEKTAHPNIYRNVSISPQLFVPNDLYNMIPEKVLTEKEERIWHVLCSCDNPKYRSNDILTDCGFFLTSTNIKYDLNIIIRKVVYGCEGNEKPTPWSMAGLDEKMIKDICFNWPFHNLFEFCGFAMTDILKIKKFNIVIKVEDEVL